MANADAKPDACFLPQFHPRVTRHEFCFNSRICDCDPSANFTHPIT